MRRAQLLRRLVSTEGEIRTTIDAMERHRTAVARVIATTDTGSQAAKQDAMAIHVDFMAARATLAVLQRDVARMRGEVRGLDGDYGGGGAAGSYAAPRNGRVVAASAMASTGGKSGEAAKTIAALKAFA